MNRDSRVLEAIRALFIIPMVLPPIIVAIIWKVLFTPDISMLNWGLGLLRLPQPAWLADPKLALPALVVADVWEWFPFTMLMLLAALKMMPRRASGSRAHRRAGPWQVFRHIVAAPAPAYHRGHRALSTHRERQGLPLIFIMTGGGPGTVTEATNYYAFLQGFTYSLLGFSAAISVVVLAATFLVSYLIVSWAGARVDVE